STTADTARPAWPSFADWLHHSNGRQHDLMHHRCGGTVPVDVCRARVTEAFDNPATDHVAIILVTAGRGEEHEIDLGHGRFSTTPVPGRAVLSSPNMPSQIKGKGPYEFVTVSFSTQETNALLERSGLSSGLDFGPLGSHAWNDAQVQSLCVELDRVSADSSPAGRLYVDGVWTSLVGRLLSLSQTSVPAVPKRAQLRSEALRNVLDLMHARLEVGVSLDELAKAAGVNPMHFGRLFKQAQGEPPYAHLTRLRVQQAKQLLQTHPEWTVAAIAGACGFADQSHLSRHFKRIVGTTPATWRKSN
ncbi:MAG: helix-turn-helix transcriptional regulator, partial [Planctomycetota bacterium]